MKVHPHRIEAERAILGGLIQQPDLLMVCDLASEDLWSQDHRNLLDLLRSMRRNRVHIDLVTVPEEVIRRGAENFGGLAYVLELVEWGVPAAIDSYISEVRADAERRRIMLACEKAVEGCKAGLADPSEVADMLVSATRAASAGRSGVESMTWADAFGLAELAIADRCEGSSTAVPTPWPELNAIIQGMDRRRLIVLAGRPGMGKSAVAQHIVEHHAEMTKLPVLDASLEMGAAEKAERSIGAHSGVNPERLRTGRLDYDERQAVRDYIDARRHLPIYVLDKSGISMGEFEREAHRLHAREGLSMACLDYLQLMRRDKAESDVLALGMISRRCKALTKDLDIPVLLLSQLNRNVDSREGRVPRASDLRGSGEIEQDADVIIMCVRPGLNDDEVPDDTIELHVVKQRNGPIGVARLGWHAGRIWSCS